MRICYEPEDHLLLHYDFVRPPGSFFEEGEIPHPRAKRAAKLGPGAKKIMFKKTPKVEPLEQKENAC